MSSPRAAFLVLSFMVGTCAVASVQHPVLSAFTVGLQGGVTILGPNVSVLQRCFRALVVPSCRSGALLLHVLPANGELV